MGGSLPPTFLETPLTGKISSDVHDFKLQDKNGLLSVIDNFPVDEPRIAIVVVVVVVVVKLVHHFAHNGVAQVFIDNI